MSHYLRIPLLILLAIITGIGVGVYRIAGVESSNAFFHNGNWFGSKHLPLGKDDLVTAQISAFALFALPGEEAIYLAALRDDEKELFHSSHDYVIKGNVHEIKALYWSITLYGRDLYLTPNAAGKYSVNNSSIETDSAGSFTVVVSHKEHKGNWLPSPDDAKFRLVLRIYKGDKSFVEGLDTATLPEIKRVKG